MKEEFIKKSIKAMKELEPYNYIYKNDNNIIKKKEYIKIKEPLVYYEENEDNDIICTDFSRDVSTPKLTVPSKFNVGEYIKWADTVEAIDYVVETYGFGNLSTGMAHWDALVDKEFVIVDVICTLDDQIVYLVKDSDGVAKRIPERFAEFIF